MVIQKGTKMDSLQDMPLFAQSSNKFQRHCKPQTESRHKNPNLASILDSFQGSKARLNWRFYPRVLRHRLFRFNCTERQTNPLFAPYYIKWP